MSRSRLFRETTLNSAIKVAQDRGLKVSAIKIDPDGTVNVLTDGISISVSAEPENPFDRLSRDKRQTKVSQGLSR